MNNEMPSNNLYVNWLNFNKYQYQLNAQNPESNTYIDTLLSQRYSFEIDLLKQLGAPKEAIDNAINDLINLGYSFIPDMTNRIYNQHGRTVDLETGKMSERVGIYANMDDSLNIDLANKLYTSISDEMKIGIVKDYKSMER